ncbi:hypothetical protein GAG94_03470 [Lysinibacillus sphaericus]|nr:hypothetical protein GAG94_03470 [Lysinibacillus sphaericus]
MTNFRKQLGYVLENKNICVNGYTENKILFQNNDGKIDKQRKATLYTNKKGVFFVFEGKRNYVSFHSEEKETNAVESNTIENKALNEMIGDVGSLIAGLQTATNGKMLNQINKEKYKPQSNFSKWLDNLVKTEIKKKIEEEHNKVVSLLRINSDLIGTVRRKVKQTFLKVFGAENLKCKTINVDKIFGESTVSKYSFLAKENGFNSNDVDQLVQSIIYRVLKDNNRLQIN